VREATDRRWCEDVTLAFHNTGGSAMRCSGTVAFGTHVIGALGVDWATIESTAKLLAPIEGGARKEHTWTVCVDAMGVPRSSEAESGGMCRSASTSRRRDVSVQWK
jgi:hypothetical protein